jgi:hypothetical protein
VVFKIARIFAKNCFVEDLDCDAAFKIRAATVVDAVTISPTAKPTLPQHRQVEI